MLLPQVEIRIMRRLPLPNNFLAVSKASDTTRMVFKG
jgi:hypothetical protein